ncbi:phage tail protein [Edwardsiella tarda]|uniref:gp53-like domain-containing protein n=1 Tax=Edwardsiella tarda TaxID=636 RepID=UPI00351C216B
MKLTDTPAKQAVPFGVNGQREALLPTTPAGDNKASYNNGFPPVTMILKSAGGVPPKGQDMNQILFELSSLCRWFSAGVAAVFDQNFADSIGGYPVGSYLLGPDNKTLYRCIMDDNKNPPKDGATGWSSLPSDIASSLGLNGAAYLNVGTTVGTVAAGDDQRILNSLNKNNNLSDIEDITNARLNLGLASAATRNVGNGANQIPDMSYFAAGDGWFKLPSGKIFQYGSVLNSNAVHNFPIPFPLGNVHTIVGTAVSIPAYQPVGNTEGIVYPNVISSSQFYMRCGTSAESNILISWFAIGE